MTGSKCSADPDSPCAKRVQRVPQEPEKPQATARAVVSSSPGLAGGGASSASPAQDSGHTAIAPPLTRLSGPRMRRGCACGPCLTGRAQVSWGSQVWVWETPGPSLRPAGLMQCLWPRACQACGGCSPTRPSVCCASHTVWKVCHHLFVGAVGWYILGHQQRGPGGGGGLPSLHLATPIPVSEFVQEAVRESLPCKPPMGSCPAALPCQCRLLTKAPGDCSALPSPEQGHNVGPRSLRHTDPWWALCWQTEEILEAASPAARLFGLEGPALRCPRSLGCPSVPSGGQSRPSAAWVPKPAGGAQFNGGPLQGSPRAAPAQGTRVDTYRVAAACCVLKAILT